MKKRLTRGEKWLFASPLLLLVFAGAVWQWKELNIPSSEIIVRGDVDRLEFSPDSRRLLVSHDSYTGLYAQEVYDVATRERLSVLGQPSKWPASSRVDSLTWSGDGTRIVGSRRPVDKPVPHPAAVAIWDAQNGGVEANHVFIQADNRWRFGEIKLSPDGKTLMGGGIPPLRYAAATGKPLNKPDASLDKNTFFQSSEELGLSVLFQHNFQPYQGFRVVNSKTKRVVWKPILSGPSGFVWSGDVLCVKDSPPPLISSRGATRLSLWNARTHQNLPATTVASNLNIGTFAIHPKTNKLAYVTYSPAEFEAQRYGSKVVVKDYGTNRELWTYDTSDRLDMGSLQWSPDGKWLAAAGYYDSGCLLYVFDQSGYVRVKRVPINFQIRWSPDSRRLATASLGRDESTKTFINKIEIHRFNDE